MQSLKRFKNRLVNGRELSARTTDCSLTVKKISDINDSGYKLDAKPTTRVAKTDHSLERKSPIRIPERYLKSHRQMTFREARQDKAIVQQPLAEEDIFRGVQSIPNSSAARSSDCQEHHEHQPSSFRPFDCATDLLREDHCLLLTTEELQCIRDIWQAIQKLRGRKQFAFYMDQMRRILNEICKRGMKPEFKFQEDFGDTTQKAIRVPSLSSNLFEQSSPENHRDTPIDSMTNSPLQERERNSNGRESDPLQFSSLDRHNSNLEYRKILYMLQRQSQSNIHINPMQSKFSDESFLNSSNSGGRQHSRLTSCSQNSQDLRQNKRVVLRQIVDMLNTKYHRNIKL